MPYNLVQEPVSTSVILIVIKFWRGIVFHYCPIWSRVRKVPCVHLCLDFKTFNLKWGLSCTRALSSNCREVSTRPLRIFRLESVGGGQRLNWVTITMRRRQHAGECALGRGPFPWPSPAVCGGICQDIYPQSTVISFSLGDD